MDLEDYGQEENDTALHLCASRQCQDNHRVSHCKCISIQSVWKFMVCMDHRLQCTTTEFYKPYISRHRNRQKLYRLYTNYRDFWGLEKLS